MKAIRLLLLSIVAVAVLAAAATFLIPEQLRPEVYSAWGMVQAAFFVTLAIGGAFLFIAGLKGFKVESKRAATFLALGAFVHAIGWAAGPIIFNYNPTIDTTTLVLFSDFPYLIGTILIFTGFWQFAKLLDIKSWATRLMIILPLLIVAVILTSFVPHAVPVESELLYDALISIVWLEVMFNILSIVLLWQLKRTISLPYARTITLLLAMTVVNLLASSSYLYVNINGLFFSSDPAVIFFTTYIMGNLYTLHIVVFVLAGYSFNAITKGAEKLQKEGSVFDVITYTASLASTPEQLDAILDPLREITAIHKAGQELDGKVLANLAKVYENIESYLIKEDRLRKFTREELRRRIEHKFDHRAYDPLFNSSGKA